MKKIDKLNEELNELKEELIIKEEQFYKLTNNSSDIENKLEEEVRNLRRKRLQLLNERAKLLKRKVKINNQNEISNLKIQYTKKTGTYEFTYSKKTGNLWVPCKLNYTFDKKNHIRKDKLLRDIYGKGKYEKLDLDLCEALRNFDLLNETNYCRRYINDIVNFDISYDMRGKNKKLSRHDNKKLDKIAEIQQMFKNAKIKRYPKKMAYKLAGLSIIGILSIGLTIKNYSKLNKSPEEIITNDVTLEMNDDKINNLKKIDTNKIKIPNDKEKIKETLYSTYNETGTEAYTDELLCDNYGVSLVAVYNTDSLIEIIKVDDNLNFDIDNFISNYKEKNGDNFDFSINVNGYDSKNQMVYEQIGWTKNLDLVKNKMLVKKM